MKIKYRRFDDLDETEVEVEHFCFHRIKDYYKDETLLEYVNKDNKLTCIFHVCEVSMEEI